MQPILNGIRGALIAASLTGVTNKIWFLQAPTGTAYPYVVITLVSQIELNQDYGDQADSVWQVSAFHTDGNAAFALQASIRSALHRANLTYTGFANLWTTVEGQIFLMEKDNDTTIYHAGVEVRVMSVKV